MLNSHKESHRISLFKNESVRNFKVSARVLKICLKDIQIKIVLCVRNAMHYVHNSVWKRTIFYSVIVIADERPDLSSAELKLKSAKQLKGKKKEKKSRLKSRNASVDTKSSDEMDEKEKNDQLLDSLTNIVITTAAEIVASIRFVFVT